MLSQRSSVNGFTTLGGTLKLAPSFQTFERYGQHFGGREPHKDDKSGGFDLSESDLRDVQRLTSLVMLLHIVHLIAVDLGMLLVQGANRSQLGWQGERGLSFLQLGLREIARRCDRQVRLLTPLPSAKSPESLCPEALPAGPKLSD